MEEGEDDDARQVELATLAAIWPDELRVDKKDPFAVFIELPISLPRPLVVRFPAASGAAPAGAGEAPQGGAGVAPLGVEDVDSQEVSNLPSLRLDIRLPEGYPRARAPDVTVSTSPAWLSLDMVSRLEADAGRLWEEMGRDQVVFTFIDHVRQGAEDVFGLVDASSGTLEVGPEHKIAILDYDINAKRRAFEKETFSCGVCLGKSEPSMGYYRPCSRRPLMRPARSPKRLCMPSHVGLRTCLLRILSAGLLQCRHHRGRRGLGALS